jgi:hypothetical protein
VSPIPLPLTGSVTALAQGVYAKHSTSISVHARLQLRFAVIFIRYQNTSVKQKALDALQQIRNMYPVAEDGVIITQYANYETTLNLQSKEGWEQLLSDVAEITEDLQHNYDVFLGLLPELPENPPGTSQYAKNGIGNSTIAWPPGGISIENLGKTAAHETGHALGLRHADCPPAGTDGAPDPDTIDNTLKPRTEEEGYDFYNHQGVPRGTGTLMSYCDRPHRWVSIDLWDRLFDKLA